MDSKFAYRVILFGLGLSVAQTAVTFSTSTASDTASPPPLESFSSSSSEASSNSVDPVTSHAVETTPVPQLTSSSPISLSDSPVGTSSSSSLSTEERLADTRTTVRQPGRTSFEPETSAGTDINTHASVLRDEPSVRGSTSSTAADGELSTDVTTDSTLVANQPMAVTFTSAAANVSEIVTSAEQRGEISSRSFPTTPEGISTTSVPSAEESTDSVTSAASETTTSEVSTSSDDSGRDTTSEELPGSQLPTTERATDDGLSSPTQVTRTVLLEATSGPVSFTETLSRAYVDGSTPVQPFSTSSSPSAVTVTRLDGGFSSMSVAMTGDAEVSYSSVEASLSPTSTFSYASTSMPEAIGYGSFSASVPSEGYVSSIASSAPTTTPALDPLSTHGMSLSLEYLETSSSLYTSLDYGLDSTSAVSVSEHPPTLSSRLSELDSSPLYSTWMTQATYSHVSSASAAATPAITTPTPVGDEVMSTLPQTPVIPASATTSLGSPTVTTLSTSPSLSPTTKSTSASKLNTTRPTTTTPKPTPPAREDVRYLFILRGDCHLILNNTEFFQRFLAGFHDLIVKQLRMSEGEYRLGDITCGSVRVYVTFLGVIMPDFDVRLQSMIRHGGPGLSVPVWIDSHFATFDLSRAQHVPMARDEHTYNIVTEVMDDVDIIVIIVACCVCGVLVAIGIAICVKECYRRKHEQTFNLLDVPHVNLKLEDFTLTRIPRPRTVYKQNSCSSAVALPPSKVIPEEDSADQSDTIPSVAVTPTTTNGHARTSCGGLRPSDMHLHVQQHSQGIIVGITASSASSSPRYHGDADETGNGTAKRAKPKVRTPPSGEDPADGEWQASQRLLDSPSRGDGGGMTNPVFVDDKEEEGHGVEGVL